MFGLAALAAVAAMAFVGATTASAETDTALCTEHNEETGLLCPKGSEATLSHLTLLEGTVGKLLSSLVTVLCLGVLIEATPLALGNPQEVHTLESAYTGCGTGSAHNNCTVTVEEEPLGSLLKTGLDEGSLSVLSGRVRLVCSSPSINCVYDTAGSLFSAGAGMLTAEKTPTKELGGKLICPNEGKLDGLLLDLPDDETYILE